MSSRYASCSRRHSCLRPLQSGGSNAGYSASMPAPRCAPPSQSPSSPPLRRQLPAPEPLARLGGTGQGEEQRLGAGEGARIEAPDPPCHPRPGLPPVCQGTHPGEGDQALDRQPPSAVLAGPGTEERNWKRNEGNRLEVRPRGLFCRQCSRLGAGNHVQHRGQIPRPISLFEYKTQKAFKTKSLGLRDGSAVQSTCCSCKGPALGS